MRLFLGILGGKIDIDSWDPWPLDVLRLRHDAAKPNSKTNWFICSRCIFVHAVMSHRASIIRTRIHSNTFSITGQPYTLSSSILSKFFICTVIIDCISWFSSCIEFKSLVSLKLNQSKLRIAYNSSNVRKRHDIFLWRPAGEDFTHANMMPWDMALSWWGWKFLIGFAVWLIDLQLENPNLVRVRRIIVIDVHKHRVTRVLDGMSTHEQYH
jgi:hypothetical protein